MNFYAKIALTLDIESMYQQLNKGQMISLTDNDSSKIDKRFQKAQIILNRPDSILQDIKDPDRYLVRAEQDPVIAYEVTFDDIYDTNAKLEKKRGKCTCIDYMMCVKYNIDHRCKHILAIFLGVSRTKKFKKLDLDEFMQDSPI